MPTVRVKLVQNVRMSPYQSVLTSACLTGCDSLHGHVLVEADVSFSEGRGFQVVDSVVVPNQEGQVTVMLTNTSCITERVLKDVDLGTATPAELIDSYENEHTQSLDLRDSLTEDSDMVELLDSRLSSQEQSTGSRPAECLLENHSASLPSVYQTSSESEPVSSWRKQKLREVVDKECNEPRLIKPC